MGLPLFIAQVESDLLSKPTNKPSSTSPQSAIRRQGSSETRDRRQTRIARLHDALGRQEQSTSNDEPSDSQDRLNPATRDGFRVHPPLMYPLPSRDPFGRHRRRPSRDLAFNAHARPRRQVLREMRAQNNERHMERLEDQTTSQPADNWWQETLQDRSPEAVSGGNSQRAQDSVVANRQSSRRARFVWPVRTRFDRSPHRPQLAASDLPDSRHSIPSSNVRDLAQQVDEQMRHVLPQGRDAGRQFPRRPQSTMSQQHLSSRRIPRVDGLGDRERSVSPEWDTLLTTLTPDPQPPSAGSSFASAAASHNASASSHSTPPIIDAGHSLAPEPPCEYAFEYSDGDDQRYEHIEYAHLRRNREQQSHRAAQRIPEYSLDGPGGGAFSTRGGSSSVPRRTPQQGVFSGYRARAFREEGRATAERFVEPLSTLRNQRNPWVGRLSVGASDEEQGVSNPSSSRESLAAQGPSMPATEEDWAGMRRIVRSMAMREDIPDEWWAEAGLSRMLPRDDTT